MKASRIAGSVMISFLEKTGTNPTRLLLTKSGFLRRVRTPSPCIHLTQARQSGDTPRRPRAKDLHERPGRRCDLGQGRGTDATGRHRVVRTDKTGLVAVFLRRPRPVGSGNFESPSGFQGSTRSLSL